MAADLRRILVVRVDKIGDLVTATPLFRSLKTALPGTELTALVSPYAAPVLAHNPSVDHVWTDNGGSVTALARQLRSGRFDASLVLLPTARHDLATLLAGIPRRIASSNRFSHLLTGARTVPHHKARDGRHEADYALDLGRALGLDLPPDQFLPEIFITEDERAAARARFAALGLDQPPVAIHPTGGGSAPNLPLATYRAVAVGLTERGFPVVITGGEAERTVLAATFGGLGSVHLLTGQLDLRGLMATLAESALFIGGSTGPMHLAAAAGTPTVAVFCRDPVMHPRRWGPLGPGHRIVTVPVGGCDRCDRAGRGNACPLPALGADPVLAAAFDLLARHGDGIELV